MKKRIVLNVSLNYFCNQKCFFCVDNNKEFLNFLRTDTDKKIYEALDDGIGKYEKVVFTSGEPTLNENFNSYIEYAKNCGYEFLSLITNGSTLDRPNTRNKILNYGLNEIIISIHGIGQVHDLIVGVNGAFKKAFRGLADLIKENNGRIKIGVSLVLNSINLRQYVKYIELFESLRVNQIIINSLRPEGFAGGDVYKKYFFSYGDFIELNKKLKETTKDKLNLLMSENKLVFTDFPICVIYNSGFHANLDGTVELRITKYGNKDTDEGTELYDNNNYWKRYIDGCKSCVFRKSCEGVNNQYIRSFGENGINPIIID